MQNEQVSQQPVAFVKYTAPVGKAVFTVRTQEDGKELSRTNGVPVHSAVITLTERQLFQAGLVTPANGAIFVQLETEENNVFQRFVTFGVRALEDASVDGIESLISLELLLSPIVFELWMNARTPNTWKIDPDVIDKALDKLKKMAEEAIEKEKAGEAPAGPPKKLLMP